jgi:HEAT repeat protein
MKPLAAIAAFAILPLFAQDSSPGEIKARVKTAKEYGKQGSVAIPKLVPMLSDPELNVRIEAVKALVEAGSQHSLDPLIQATKDNDAEIQIRATDGLVNFYLPGYVQTGLTASIKRSGTRILSRFTDTNDQIIPAYIEVRPEIVEALGKLASGGASMEVRANAARAIGVLRGRKAIPYLMQALRTKDDQVLYESLIALQKIRDASAGPGILFLLRDLNEKVQIAAIETTGLLLNREALPQLRAVFDRARNDKVRRAALSAIAMMPDPANRELYSAYIRDNDDGLRAAAAEGFARLRRPEDAPMLEKEFNDERKMNPRLSLAFGLVMTGKHELTTFSPLQYLINTLNSKAYKGVARSFLLEATRDLGARRAVYPALGRGTKEEKIQLSQILAESGDKDTVAQLEPLTRDVDTDVAQEALRALRNLKARLP